MVQAIKSLKHYLSLTLSVEIIVKNGLEFLKTSNDLLIYYSEELKQIPLTNIDGREVLVLPDSVEYQQFDDLCDDVFICDCQIYSYDKELTQIDIMNYLKGKTLISAECNRDNDTISFVTSDNIGIKFYHFQDCCESVYIENISGNFDDLVGSPLILCEESTGELECDEVGMWTFYRFATIKGYVNIRWNGQSNGDYSVSVDKYAFLNEDEDE